MTGQSWHRTSTMMNEHDMIIVAVMYLATQAGRKQNTAYTWRTLRYSMRLRIRSPSAALTIDHCLHSVAAHMTDAVGYRSHQLNLKSRYHMCSTTQFVSGTRVSEERTSRNHRITKPNGGR